MAVFKRRLRDVEGRSVEEAFREVIRQLNAMQDDMEQWCNEESKRTDRTGATLAELDMMTQKEFLSVRESMEQAVERLGQRLDDASDARIEIKGDVTALSERMSQAEGSIIQLRSDVDYLWENK